MLSSDIFNREFKQIHEPWTKKPITLTLADTQNLQGNSPEPIEKNDLESEARRILKLRDELLSEDANLSKTRYLEIRKELSSEEPGMMGVPSEEFNTWFAEEKTND